ncbi:hypothetical protein [Lysinibacillus agricola]|uniref:hypothetical protein n=1 Tax=Lysinibacillus agricola TaxID=2590012 RepID=UPI003C1D8F83
MSSNIAPNIESADVFLGFNFLEYIDFDSLKQLISQNTGEEYDVGTVAELYSMISNDTFNAAFFECVLFNHLKNVFIHKIASDKIEFKSKIIEIIKNINTASNIPSALNSYLREDGFNFISKLGKESNFGDKFVVALEYVENEDIDEARILFSQVVINKAGTAEYSVSGVIVDFRNQKCLICLKNKTNLGKAETPELEEKLKSTVSSFHSWIVNQLKYVFDFVNHNVDNSRKHMYEICKGFDEELLKEDRKLIDEKLNESILTDIIKYSEIITSEAIQVSASDKEALRKSMLSLMTGVYVKSKYQHSQLQQKAKALGLPGYPTKIEYTSTKSDKGATQSSGKKEPVGSSDIFHSLYISFEEARSLEKWSIAWFTDYENKEPRNHDVIQTTIHAKVSVLHVVFLPTRALNKELIYHVIRSIGE